MLSLLMGLVAKNTCISHKPLHSTYLSILQDHPALHVGIHLNFLLRYANSKPLLIENMYILYTILEGSHVGSPCSIFKAAVVKCPL